MSDYYEEDFHDDDREVVRPKAMKKNSSFSYCKWAPGDWEARFYAWTPAHKESRRRHLKVLMNDPCWYNYNPKKDAKLVAQNNKARGKR